MPEIQNRVNLDNTVELYQDSQQNVTSKELEVNGGLNLAVRRAKANNTGPGSSSKESVEPKSARKRKKKLTGQDSGKQKAATTAESPSHMSLPAMARNPNTSTPRKELKDKSKEITRKTSAAKVL